MLPKLLFVLTAFSVLDKERKVPPALISQMIFSHSAESNKESLIESCEV
jgi:hypothetical protein